LIHGGTSTVCAIGTPPDSEAWKIAIGNPETGQPLTPSLSPPDGERFLPTKVCALPPRTHPHPLPGGEPDRAGALRSSPPGRGQGWVGGFMERAADRPGEGPAPKPPLAIIPLCDESLSISAVSGKCFTANGRTFGHVIDPRTGEPASRALLSAVVLPSGAETDALSTALVIIGPEGLDTITALRPGMRVLVAGQNSNGQASLKSHGIELSAAPPVR
jgi:thiamine biosynthesis lipoprotein ApbE